MSAKPIASSALNVALGDAFKLRRENAGLSLRTLAGLMERSVNTIRWHEGGETPLRANDLVMAARIIGCSMDALTGYQHRPPPKRKRRKT